MAKSKSFSNLLTDLHSDPLPDSATPTLSLSDLDRVAELSPLRPEETERLAACETIIEEGFATFLAVGNALMEIRRDKLYRSGFQTFEAYCRERFQLKRQRAYELMGAADVVQSLSATGTVDLPQRESHARALADLPVENRAEVWQQVQQEATQTGQVVTAKKIAQTAQKKSSKTEGQSGRSEQKAVRQMVKKAVEDDLRIEVSGRWLLRCGLVDAWCQLRNRPDWVITDDFRDSLSWQEARQVGLID